MLCPILFMGNSVLAEDAEQLKPVEIDASKTDVYRFDEPFGYDEYIDIQGR